MTTGSELKHRKKSKEVGKKPLTSDDGELKDEFKNPKFGQLPHFTNQRVLTRLVLLAATLVVVYFTSNQEKVVHLARVNEIHESRRQDLKCSDSYYNEVADFPGCFPLKCGRVVMDNLLASNEVRGLIDIVKRGLALGGSDGGASILDLHSGALSKGKHFINLYALSNISEILTPNDFALYIRVRRKIQESIAFSFNIDSSKLHLTKPTFFSRLTSVEPATIHDEYWHPHVDKETYKSFHYTSLVYLNDFNTDFKGGRFVFDDPENVSMIVEPKRGRVSAFTSGQENLHHVERVTSGTRYAITVSFTCDKKYGITDPSFQKIK